MKIITDYTWPVVCQEPNGGDWEEQKFVATFAVAPVEKLIEVGEGGLGDLAKESLIDWAGIEDEDGREIPYSSAMKDRLFDVPYIRAGIIEALRESVIKAQDRAGN